MIKVAILGHSELSPYIEDFIGRIYNPTVIKLGGEPLEIKAILLDDVQRGDMGKSEEYIDLTTYINMYLKGEINALIMPKEQFNYQSSIITTLMKHNLPLDDVYILKRLINAEVKTEMDIADYIVPYLSAKYQPYIEYHVADQCNLNCIACEHYSGLVEEDVFPDFSQFEKEFRRMKELVDDIGMLRILGGEPLLNPELERYVRLSRELYPRSNIFIVTNGILVRQMSRELIGAMKDKNVNLFISYYPPLIDKMPEIEKFLKEKGISYSMSSINTSFTKKQTLIPAEDTGRFYDCYQAHCVNLYQGRMAACFLPFTTKYFNKQYGEKLPEDGAIDIMGGDISPEDLAMGLLQPFERCRYCTEPVDVEWDYVRDKSDLGNWLVEVEKKSEKLEPLITIYTQCYNGEAYLEQCIESVLNQTYTNFEYYVCNHGSTDRTGEILEKYAKKDSRIKPLYFENKERGFYPDYMKEHAEGKYFAMLDSDDWWAPNHLEKMVPFAERYQLDMAICGVDSYYESDGTREINRKVQTPLIFNINAINQYWIHIYDFFRTAWGKLIRMDVLKKADFSFYYENAKTFISDDTAFTLSNLAECKRIGALPDCLITYRVRNTSVSKGYKPSLMPNNYNIYCQSLQLLQKISDKSEDSKLFMLNVFINVVEGTFALLMVSSLTVEEKYQELIRNLEYPYIREFVSYQEGMFSFVDRIKYWIEENKDKLSEEEVVELEKRL